MLLPEIDRFLRKSGMPATTFGRLAMNDPRFVHDLRRGRQPRPGAIARVRGFIAGHPLSAASSTAIRDARSSRR